MDPLALAEALEAGVRPVGFGEQETLLVTLAPGILPPLQGVEASPGGTLLVSRELPPCRFRLAVAHGLAHLALGHLGEPPSRTDLARGQALPHDPEAEREANALAAALLMPEEIFRQAWRATGHQSVYALAALFGVSPKAVVLRAWMLGLEPLLP